MQHLKGMVRSPIESFRGLKLSWGLSAVGGVAFDGLGWGGMTLLNATAGGSVPNA